MSLRVELPRRESNISRKPSKGQQSAEQLRYVLPITLSCLYVFFRQEKTKNLPVVLSDAVKFAVAVNEYVDLGISAELRMKEDGTHLRKTELRFFKNRLKAHVEEKREELLSRHGDENPRLHDSTRTFMADASLLSRSRSDFRGREDAYLELDSGIFESFFLYLACPQALQELGIDLANGPCSDAKELKDRYKIFLADNIGPNLSPTQRKIVGLHMLEMVMKVNDDRQGERVDVLTRVPTYLDYLKSHDEENIGRGISELRQSYLANAASLLGIPKLPCELAVCVHNATSIAKSHLGKKGLKPVEFLDWRTALPKALKSTTMRHQLEETGLLNELLNSSRWP